MLGTCVKKIFSVFDKKSGKYGFPMLFDDEVAASRSFDALVNNRQESLISRYPEDFALHYIADFDIVTAKFESVPSPVVVVEALQLKKE